MKTTMLSIFYGGAKKLLSGLAASRLPKVKGKETLNGLRAEVQVIRDEWGVPHIYAHSVEDAVFAQGFTHAQDRLWQMDINRRVVQGRLSEVLGQPALETDITLRTLGLRRWAEQEAAQVQGFECALLDAYCAGVNAAMARGRLPLEFMLLRYTPEPWLPADVLSFNKLMFLSLGASWDSELLRGQMIEALGAETYARLGLEDTAAWPLILDANLPFPYRPGPAYSGPARRDGVGSNNWVLSSSRSRSGMPMLANDMHLGLTAPGIFYQNHLCAGDLNVIGVTFPGVPLVVQGHNGRVAWGFTNGFADVQDLYEEHLRTVDGRTEYEFRGQWLPVAVRREEIRVKGQPLHVEEVMETSHGPLVNRALFKGITPEPPPMAMRWTAFSVRPLIATLYQMNLAHDCLQFRQALRGWTAPVQNVVYADTLGNIAYTQAGVIPTRAGSLDGSTPLPGWTGEHEWTGEIPFEELPHLFNPPRGYVVTANNRTAGADYPHFLGRDYIYRDRAQRITEMVEECPQADLGWMQHMQFDLVSPSARALAKAVGGLTSDDPRLAAAIHLLRDWDGKLDAFSAPAALYEVLARKIIERMLAGQLDGFEERVRGKWPGGVWEFHAWEWMVDLLDQPASPWWGPGRDSLLLEALRESVEFLSGTLGPEMAAWQWGALHQLTFPHILGRKKPLDQVFERGPYAVGGDGGTVWATTTSLFDLSHQSMVGPPFRFTIDMADPDHARVIFVPGQSGNPASVHYDDGIEDWFEGKYHVLWFRREEVERAARARLLLKPGSA